MRVGDFEEWNRAHGDRVRAEILAGTYEPQPVRRVEIPKRGGGGVSWESRRGWIE